MEDHIVKTTTHSNVTEALAKIVEPHVASFDWFLEEGGGLAQAVQSLSTVQVDPDVATGSPGIRVWIERASIGYPTQSGGDTNDSRVLPADCREGKSTYSAVMVLELAVQVINADGTSVAEVKNVVRQVGELPIMVMSNRCHLRHMSRDELVDHHEEANELGGYFIINGNERVLRMLILPRRNYVTALVRSSFTNRGHGYTEYATTIRCVHTDQKSHSLTLHYLQQGTCRLRFTFRKTEYFIPVVLLLKGFIECTDREIYERITQGNSDNSFVCDRVEVMLREHKLTNFRTRTDVLRHLGNMFRVQMRKSNSIADEELGRMLLKDHIFIHCCDELGEPSHTQKFNLLVVMVQKLLALVSGEIKPENADALSMHELLLPGHLYCNIVREQMQVYLDGIVTRVETDRRLAPNRVNLLSSHYLSKVLSYQVDIGKRLQYFITTGNLLSPSGLDLMQTSGFTIVGDKLNFYRFLSHFRAVHRGQFFTEMKTTAVRKLLPTHWGFICPVHTPDGAPCGLLNHLSAVCQVVAHPSKVDRDVVIRELCELGMRAYTRGSGGSNTTLWRLIPIMLNGTLVGHVEPKIAELFVEDVRHLKVEDDDSSIPWHTEIVAVLDNSSKMSVGIQLHTGAARMIRPVRRIVGADYESGPIEWVGTMEQTVMDIACTPTEIVEGVTTHIETDPVNMLSVLASMTPFSDFNQSPRNMYQCQMSKQTMGMPLHAFSHRTDNKLYRLMTPQAPLVRNSKYDEYLMDEYPLGTNAIVAVLSYTGYDMEDAMILNKSSVERGFAHGVVYKSMVVDLVPKLSNQRPSKRFGNLTEKDGNSMKVCPSLDDDGLPVVGSFVRPGDALYCTVDLNSGRTSKQKHKGGESAYVEEVRVLGTNHEMPVKASIKLRIVRNPIIGDKFSSRHGQKGVLSRLWPQEDMPFTEAGMVPDLIINPHAMPSRMTMGMLIESMAGKSAALHGIKQNSTPFRFSDHEGNRAVDFFGEELLKSGYSYYGNETFYSGVTGEEFHAEIFLGVVYYQRLRHMVSDKSQVRATGPINPLTRQPVKGRKVGGGIRFGEMERDSLIAHGTSFLLKDRLMNCSDYSVSHVCSSCGSMLSTITVGHSPQISQIGYDGNLTCRNCNNDGNVVRVAIPYVFNFLVNELAAMNVRVTIDIK